MDVALVFILVLIGLWALFFSAVAAIASSAANTQATGANRESALIFSVICFAAAMPAWAIIVAAAITYLVTV